MTNLYIIQELRNLSDDGFPVSNLSMEFEEIARFEEIAWRQGSRVLWLNKGIQTQNFSQDGQCPQKVQKHCVTLNLRYGYFRGQSLRTMNCREKTDTCMGINNMILRRRVN